MPQRQGRISRQLGRPASSAVLKRAIGSRSDTRFRDLAKRISALPTSQREVVLAAIAAALAVYEREITKAGGAAEIEKLRKRRRREARRLWAKSEPPEEEESSIEGEDSEEPEDETEALKRVLIRKFRKL